ncbi:hypothetical protein F9C11_29755 [Amycolatopsis sp. VS8301801F10]|uniref:hypothetical protein n=1 Tax=Amycolatopsis sp. VS8301801F10 TaxID=2652442 RepID=UPI0038FD2BD6
MIPAQAELRGLGFRELAAKLAAARLTDPPRGEPADPNAYYYDWYLAIRWFTEKFVETCCELTDAEWPRYSALADELFRAAAEFSGIERWKLYFDQFRLSAALLMRVPPRPDVPVLDPDRLLKDYLSVLSISPEEAARRKARRRELRKAEEQQLWETSWLMSQIKFVEHLFSESPELDEYRKWRQLWPEPPR